MSVTLRLKKDDMEIELGRSYNYKVDRVLPENHDTINDAINRITDTARVDLAALASYSPKKFEDMVGVVEDMKAGIDDLVESLLRYGRASVIVELIEEGFAVSEE